MCTKSTSIVCQNSECSFYGKPTSHIRRYGKTRKGIQRYQCKQCNATFTQNKGTFFYKLRTQPQTILECFVLIAQDKRLATIKRIKGIKEDTLVSWLQIATNHVEEVESLLISNHRINSTQLEKLWTYAERYSPTTNRLHDPSSKLS